MKISGRILFAAGLVFALGCAVKGPFPVLAAADPFLRTLTTGMSGDDVIQLQKILNQDPVTRVSLSGPGSIGQETAYFGALTSEAVARFQNKYASQILAPNGLAYGTGIVGPSTRAVLNQLAVNVAPISAIAAVPVLTAATPPSIAPTATNPNLKNLDKFIAAVDATAVKQGVSPSQLAVINNQIKKDAATTTDLTAAFLKQVKIKNLPTAANHSFVGGLVATAVRAFDRVFRPERAEAAGAVPFGGALYYAYYCTCSFTWLIGLEPLPPSYAVLLTYIPFSEIFLGYNIPFTWEMLGAYVPGAGECWVYAGYFCFTIPSEGMISPFVGSAPL